MITVHNKRRQTQRREHRHTRTHKHKAEERHLSLTLSHAHTQTGTTNIQQQNAWRERGRSGGAHKLNSAVNVESDAGSVPEMALLPESLRHANGRCARMHARKHRHTHTHTNTQTRKHKQNAWRERGRAAHKLKSAVNVESDAGSVPEMRLLPKSLKYANGRCVRCTQGNART
jgi:hypothetical protein